MRRSRLAVAVAAVSLAAVPAATAQAKPNDFRYTRSSEAVKETFSTTYCRDTKLFYDSSIEQMRDAIGRDDSAASFQALDDAGEIREEARRRGCAWA